MPKSVLITGANRGLGLAFTRQYATEGWRVLACCRHPETAALLQQLAASSGGNVSLHALDVTDHAAAQALADQQQDTPLDVLINNAGLFGPGYDHPGQRFGSIDYASWTEVLKVNTLAPLKMAEAFLPHLEAGNEKKIITLSSAMGSITHTPGAYYSYRSSKAAVNMVMATLAKDLAPSRFIVVVVDPGWAKTDMGGAGAPLDPNDSVTQMRHLIDHLTPGQSGTFLRYDGSKVPW